MNSFHYVHYVMVALQIVLNQAFVWISSLPSSWFSCYWPGGIAWNWSSMSCLLHRIRISKCLWCAEVSWVKSVATWYCSWCTVLLHTKYSCYKMTYGSKMSMIRSDIVSGITRQHIDILLTAKLLSLRLTWWMMIHYTRRQNNYLHPRYKVDIATGFT